MTENTEPLAPRTAQKRTQRCKIFQGDDVTALYTGESDEGIGGIMRDMRDVGITIEGVTFTPEGFVTGGRFVTSFDTDDTAIVRVHPHVEQRRAPPPQDEVTP